MTEITSSDGTLTLDIEKDMARDRNRFASLTARPTTLTDQQLIDMLSEMDDDVDDDDYVKLVIAYETSPEAGKKFLEELSA